MITFITGNPDKLAELQTVFGSQVDVTHRSIDLTEIQSFDTHEIIRHKLREAYDHISSPVMVEDVSAGLASMNGFPGPFIKYLFERMGDNALYEIGAPHDRVEVTCTMGYYDGAVEIIVDGVQHGIVVAPRGSEGFGFDATIVPDGYDQTLAELGTAVKNTISHRHQAAVKMIEALKQRGIC